MKYILLSWLCHTLFLLILKRITICHAIEVSDNLARNYYEERNNNNRRGYGLPDIDKRAIHYFEAAYADDARRASQQDNWARTSSETKFAKPSNLREPQYQQMQSGILRNDDTSEIDISTGNASSTENPYPNEGLANNTVFSSSAISLFKTNFTKPNADTCSCEGSGANEEISFLCFSSKDGYKNLSIKYKGKIMFSLEDIIEAYKLYYDNMQAHNFNFSESNNKHEFYANNKFNYDLSKFKINEANLNLNSDSMFGFNEITKGANKFQVNTFDKFEMKAIKEDSNKFNSDFIKNDGQSYFNGNNKFQTQYDKNVNTNSNLENNSKMEAWKKVEGMAESNKSNKFSFGNSFNVNQFSYDSDANSLAEKEAQAETYAQANAIAKAQAILQAQAQAQAILQAQAQAQAEAKVQSIIQNQIIAQAQAEAQAQAMAQAQAEAQFKAQADAQFKAQADAQFKAHHDAQFKAQHDAQFKSLAEAQYKAQADAQFKAQTDAQFKAQHDAQFKAQHDAQFKAQAEAQYKAQGQNQVHAQSQAQAYSFGQSHVNSQTQNNAFSFSNANHNGHLNSGVNLGMGGEKIFGNGFNLGFNGAFGASGARYGKQTGGAFAFGGGVGGAGSFGGHGFLAGKSALIGKSGLGIDATAAYTGGDDNYADAEYDEYSDDGYVATGYPGPLTFPASKR